MTLEIFSFSEDGSSIETFHLIEMKWTRAAPAKHDCLAAGFIDDAVAFQAARNANRFALCVISRDQSRIRPRAESLGAWNCVGRNQLNDA